MVKVLGNGVTTDKQLNAVGRKIFKSKWMGVFSSDVSAKTINIGRTRGAKYFIINVDGSSEPGSHWLAVAYDGHKFHIYDSFGRRSNKLIPSFIKTIGYDYIDSNDVADQKTSETNCGARCAAWLVYAAKYGTQSAGNI